MSDAIRIDPSHAEESFFFLEDMQLSMLVRFILFRLNTGRDVKIIIVSRSATTGTGKTTLAVAIAKFVHSLLQCTKCSEKNEHGREVGGYFLPSYDECPHCGSRQARAQEDWSAEKNAFMDVGPYQSRYKSLDRAGQCLILDEAEMAADSRRSQSHDNVDLSHAWTSLRAWNTVSILTLPSQLHVDKRMEELGDVLIRVQQRGKGNLRWLWLNDYEEEIQYYRVRSEFGMVENIYWDDLSSDPEYRTLSEMKLNHMRGEAETYIQEEELQKRMQDKEKEWRKDIAERAYERGLTQAEVGEVVDRSQQWVSKALND